MVLQPSWRNINRQLTVNTSGKKAQTPQTILKVMSRGLALPGLSLWSYVT